MDYEQFRIKRFDLWDLYVHVNQYPYVGRCYAAAQRENARKITDMTMLEGEELFGKVIPAWDKAISQLFNHDRLNVALLGNTWPHLHAHLIPRYITAREAFGVVFTDPNPKGNYSPYPKKELPLETLHNIKNFIKAKL
jgi:diadenosine tetraphosphate (Ap4A) HIT family hydrolase